MAPMTPGRRSVGTALLFLGAAALAGVSPGALATDYLVFGLPEALLGFLLTFVLLERGAWTRPPGALGWLPIGYGALANAQIFTLLLPPAGVLQWMSIVGVLFILLAALAMESRRRLVGLLAGMSVLLALLKYSVIPFVWARSGPGPGEAFGLGRGLESVRRIVVEHQPGSGEGQVLGAAALALWIIGSRLLWRHEPQPTPPVSR